MAKQTIIIRLSTEIWRMQIRKYSIFSARSTPMGPMYSWIYGIRCYAARVDRWLIYWRVHWARAFWQCQWHSKIRVFWLVRSAHSSSDSSVRIAFKYWYEPRMMYAKRRKYRRWASQKRLAKCSNVDHQWHEDGRILQSKSFTQFLFNFILHHFEWNVGNEACSIVSACQSIRHTEQNKTERTNTWNEFHTYLSGWFNRNCP